MKITFLDFAEDVHTLPDGSIVLEFLEAMEGEGPDGKVGAVGTGIKFNVRMSRDVALNHCIEVAIAAGLMEDSSKPEVADLGKLREELKKHGGKK